MIDESIVVARVDALKQERDSYIVQANQTIAAYNAAISELTRLVAPPPEPQSADSAANQE